MRASCGIDGCNGRHKGLGLCALHYNRLRRNGTPISGRPNRLPNDPARMCAVDGCGGNAVALHYCVKHYAKFKKFGDPLAGYVQDGRSKEWHANKVGYVIRFDPTSPYAGGNKLVYQHREVIGQLIGRPLRSDESVHHKNGDRTDNRPENLELWVRSQPAGQRVQDLVKWAREIITKYGNFVG